MAAEHNVLFTIIPRGISVNPEQMPVSIVVSPRLSGDDHLGAFADWLNWTERLKEQEVTFELECDGNTTELSIDTEVLRPDLWVQLFNEETLVRPFDFDDYTGHGMISYSVRDTLSALKIIYQRAGIELALPEDPEAQADDKQRRGNRRQLEELLNGLEVNWNKDVGEQWREAVRNSHRFRFSSAARFPNPLQAFSGSRDSEGLYVAEADPVAFKKTAIPFAVYHHMPTPDGNEHELSVDTDNLLDFHQVLSSLNAYPELQRALGLVFDLDLPHHFVAETAPGSFETITVTGIDLDWEIEPGIPALKTAYVHLDVAEQHLFFTAPKGMESASPTVSVLGLLNLDPRQYGLAQVDMDGGMHKSIMLAETVNNSGDRNMDDNAEREAAPHPEVYDPDATLPSLRSGGFSLFADRRGLMLLGGMTQSKMFNETLESGGDQPRPFFAEDLVKGYRLDVWDSHTEEWHSLHLRNGKYLIGEDELPFETKAEEGFQQTGATQPAEGTDTDADDLYLHEAIARWAGWSLSVEQPAKHLSKHADPDKAIPPDGEDPDYQEDQPDTPFKMRVDYKVVPGSLPRLKFGSRYRLRARAVDLAGNSLELDNELADVLSRGFSLPRDPEGTPYLRYEPVIAPLLVLRDERSVIEPGSAIDRLVIRTFNDDISKDTQAADTTAADRHIVPPRTSAEMGIRLGMFDDDSGVLKSNTETYKLIAERDAGEFQSLEITVAGQTDKFPIEEGEQIDALPHLPDLLSRGAAIRNLPGTPSGSVGKATPEDDEAGQIPYQKLSDPNPRPGSATMISFNGSDDWQQTKGFRLALKEPDSQPAAQSPHWDPEQRLLEVYLAKGQTSTVPLSSYLRPDDLKLMGIWKWIREYIERITVTDPEPRFLEQGQPVDRIAHVLQRAVEGGHWMLTPPTLLTLVHAVQQPIGRPGFSSLSVDFEEPTYPNPLQKTPIAGRQDPTELAVITAWRELNATDALLMGALKVHAASTVKVDLQARWQDPVDEPSAEEWQIINQAGHVEELQIPNLREQYLNAKGKGNRKVGYYDPEHDQIGFVRRGDTTGTPEGKTTFYYDAAPRHLFNDTKHHVVEYTAVSTSRYREYFPQDLDFTRVSEPVKVDVPASARPLAPDVKYVIPTFGWQRQTETNLKRSVRFGGGMRVYMERPWFSSGAGELLGVTLWSSSNGPLDEQNRDKFKPFFTQWGMDPIWQTGDLYYAPGIDHFPDAARSEYNVTLEEATARLSAEEAGRVSVAGFEPQFDKERGLWYADLTVNTLTDTYMPFIRLALARYQPHALADAKISRVVLADFAQLTPTRSAIVTTDPHHPGKVRLTVSGIAPQGPKPVVRGMRNVSENPTQIKVHVQKRDPAVQTDLGWQNVDADEVSINAGINGPVSSQPDTVMWSGTVTFGTLLEAGSYRLLIEEYEYISANYTVAEGRRRSQPGRLIYAETFELDDALLK